MPEQVHEGCRMDSNALTSLIGGAQCFGVLRALMVLGADFRNLRLQQSLVKEVSCRHCMMCGRVFYDGIWVASRTSCPAERSFGCAECGKGDEKRAFITCAG